MCIEKVRDSHFLRRMRGCVWQVSRLIGVVEACYLVQQ